MTAMRNPSWQSVDGRIHESAIKIAQRCRYIIQACLREEEWSEADREFYLVAREILEEVERCRTTNAS